MSVFYDHIIHIHHVHSEVETLPTTDNHKQELIEIIEETVHHKIIHKILDHLHTDHHELFLERFHTYPNDETILGYLKKYVPDIEHHIKEAAEEVKYELLKSIRY
ncbi:hypothetical protein ACFL1M_00650 [Patescibacteria group bacterium]